MLAVTWPDHSSAWWWMRFKLKPHSPWRVVLVTRDDHEGCEFIRPHQDCNCYPQSFAAEWQAGFVPAPTPPEPVAFEITPAAERPDVCGGRGAGGVSAA